MNPHRFPDLYGVDTGTCRPSVRRWPRGMVVVVRQLSVGKTQQPLPMVPKDF